MGLVYGIFLPEGVTFAELPASCEQESIDGMTVAFCEESDVVLEAGEFFTHTVRVKVAKSVDPIRCRVRSAGRVVRRDWFIARTTRQPG